MKSVLYFLKTHFTSHKVVELWLSIFLVYHNNNNVGNSTYSWSRNRIYKAEGQDVISDGV